MPSTISTIPRRRSPARWSACRLDGLGIDYIQRRVDLINNVTLDEVQAAARKLLSVEPAVMVLGPALEDGGKG